jgi:Tfp pilus assembly protein PilO
MIEKLYSFIKQLSTSSKLIGSVILVVFVVSLLVFQTLSIRDLNETIKKEENALNLDRTRLLHIESIKKNYLKSLEKLYSLEAKLPNTPSEESIITSLQETSESSLTDFSKISFGKTSTVNGLNQFSLSISYNGSFINLLELLNKINSGSRTVVIENLGISKERNKNNLKAEMQASAFYIPTSNSANSSSNVTIANVNK